MTILAPLLELAADGRPASQILSGMARDGYMTGVIVAPRPVPTLRWLAPLLADDDLLLADNRCFLAERDAILGQYTAIATAIDRHLARLEAERIWGVTARFAQNCTLTRLSQLTPCFGSFVPAVRR